VADRRHHPGIVVAPEDASIDRTALGQRRVFRLDEDHGLLWHERVDLGWVTDARRQNDAIGAMLDERPKRPLLPRRVVQAGHHEDGVSLAGGGLLEAGGQLAVHRVGQVVQQKTEDVGPPCAQAARGSVGYIAKVRGGGTHRGSCRLTDPRVVLERSRCRRLGCPGVSRHVGQPDPPLCEAARPRHRLCVREGREIRVDEVEREARLGGDSRV
jgi:hypothetical protein